MSSVAGASSARSGLRIRARCVVKAVGPCQHVLKVRQTSYGLLGNFDIELHVAAFKLLCLLKILPRIKFSLTSYDHRTRFDHMKYLGFSRGFCKYCRLFWFRVLNWTNLVRECNIPYPAIRAYCISFRLNLPKRIASKIS